jgi:hypothetical protein
VALRLGAPHSLGGDLLFAHRLERDAVAVLAEQGPDERDVAGADQGVTDQQAAADVALGVREPVSGAVSAEQAGLSEGPSVPAVGL